MAHYLEIVDQRDYKTTEFMLKNDVKDYEIFTRLIRSLGVDPAHHEMIDSVLPRAVDRGFGDQTTPAICEVLFPNHDAKKPKASP